jgi:hypothetical protein
MPRERQSKYFWPASAITPADMALLHAARETSNPRVPISALIARAVRSQYGSVVFPAHHPEPSAMPKAA